MFEPTCAIVASRNLFLTEWMTTLQRPTGTLDVWSAYRFGEMNYQHRHETGICAASVRENTQPDSFRYLPS